MFDLLLLGRWLPGQVQCVWTESTFAPTPDAQRQIDTAWHNAASRPGVHLFDGPLCRFESVSTAGNTLTLSLSRTGYKAFVGTNMARQDSALPCDRTQLADPVGLSVALESADGRLLLGRRNDRVAYYPGYVHPFAGALEPAGNVDVFADALRELTEEIAIAPDDITDTSLVAIVADPMLRQPELIFLAKTRIDCAAIRKRLDPTEHRAVVDIAPAELNAALAGASNWTPVAVAAALLFGREKIGPAWFDERLAQLGIKPLQQSANR